MSEYFIIAICLLILVIGARIIVGQVHALSRMLRVSAFGVSVILLGFLTSLPEFSVAVNAQIDQQPQIYAGNLMGGVFLLLCGIIPLFAYIQNGISLKRSLHDGGLFAFIGLLSLPLLAALNGVITRPEAAVMIFGYLAFLVFVKPVSVQRVRHTRIPLKVLASKILIIGLAAVAIFLACNELVHITEAMASRFGIPTFIISFLVLSLGTNIPELTLALQAILKRTSDVAFGDYVGSAAANPLILGVFSFIHGSYALGIDNLLWMIGVFLLVNVVFLFFAWSHHRLSKREAIGLLGLYLVVSCLQFLGAPQV